MKKREKEEIPSLSDFLWFALVFGLCSIHIALGVAFLFFMAIGGMYSKN